MDFHQWSTLSIRSSTASEDRPGSSNGDLTIIQRAKRKWKDVEDLDEYSQESLELIERSLDYLRLYNLRYGRECLTKQLFTRINFFARLYKVPNYLKVRTEFVRKFQGGNTHMISSQPCNLASFLKEVDHLEERYGRQLWDLYYISGWELFGKNNKDYYAHFSIRIISILRELFRAVMSRDWNSVAIVIESIPLFHHPQVHAKLHFKAISHALSYYIPAIYLATLQCFLESTKAIRKTSEHFIQAGKKFSQVQVDRLLDHSVFFAIHSITFHLANLSLERVDLVTENKFSHFNTEWNRVFYIYRYCVNSEKFLATESAFSVGQRHSLSNFFNTIFHSLLEEPTKSATLLPLFVHLAKQFDYLEVLAEALEELCVRTPSTLIQIYGILQRFELDHIAGRIIEKILYTATDLLASTDFVLDVVEQRSLDPSSHGVFDEVVRVNLRLLFAHLDLGRNRTESRAWGLLHSNLLYAGENVGIFAGELWRERAAWWTKFHRVALPKLARRERRRVFRLLDSFT